ncbi:hypothetical protein [Spirosoma pulveris]
MFMRVGVERVDGRPRQIFLIREFGIAKNSRTERDPFNQLMLLV